MGVEVRLNTSKLSALARDLSPGMISAVLRRAGFETERTAKSEHKYVNRTGYLTGSLGIDTKETYSVTVGYSAGYAPYVEKWAPFLQPAAQKAVNNLARALEAMLRRAQ